MNSQGCGFGAVEKLLNKQYTILYVGYPHKMRRECVFFCDVPDRCLYCRGAIGYITGALAPKTDGVILIYDFSNTPTAISHVAGLFFVLEMGNVAIFGVCYMCVLYVSFLGGGMCIWVLFG